VAPPGAGSAIPAELAPARGASIPPARPATRPPRRGVECLSGRAGRDEADEATW